MKQRRNLVCTLEACQAEYTSDSKTSSYCSISCKKTAQILEWACVAMQMKQEGKTVRQIGDVFGISKMAMKQRLNRLPKYCARYPDLDSLQQPQENVSWV